MVYNESLINYRRNLWRSLSFPIRPSSEVVNNLLNRIIEPSSVLVLGATTEFVLKLVDMGCREIVVVDKDPISLIIMREHIKEKSRYVIEVESDWFLFLKDTSQRWQYILMDCGLFFIPSEKHSLLLELISSVLFENSGEFLSRQLVCGSREECKNAWVNAIHSDANSQNISVLRLANAIIASNYGTKPVSYFRLQRIVRMTLYRLLKIWGNELPKIHQNCMEEFLRIHSHRIESKQKMTIFPSPFIVEKMYRSIFSWTSTKTIEGPLKSFYRLYFSGGKK